MVLCRQTTQLRFDTAAMPFAAKEILHSRSTKPRGPLETSAYFFFSVEFLLASALLRSPFVKERLNLTLKGVLVDHAYVPLGNPSVAVNEQGHRERRKSAVSVG